ncbi:uncharacterized protein LOC143628109 [Bidens hawaiensis]|uniref:uncharacterized protein LOC143628109 n=1 Tax=Bidens hawaiensis TaxID=980011 RepID=UPI00404AE2CD
MASLLYFLCTFLTFSSYFREISAVNYVVKNEAGLQHTGGTKFENIIGGIPYTIQIMGQINNFIWSTVLQENTPEDRKVLENDSVFVYIKDFIGGEAVTWGSNRINVSAVYLRDYNEPMDLKWEFTSLLYHEMTHVFQWNGEGKCPQTVVEGVADYTILKANFFPPGFKPSGAGKQRDQGYDYTARSFEYCDTLTPNFVAKFNKMIRKTYDVSFFKTITGKPVEQLWKDYKAKYPGVNYSRLN